MEQGHAFCSGELLCVWKPASGALLGPGRDQAPDHEPSSHNVATAARRELGIIWSESRWVDASAIHCMVKIVHLYQSWAGQKGTNKYIHKWLRLHAIYLGWTNNFLSSYGYHLMRRIPWPADGEGKILGWFTDGLAQYIGGPKGQCWEQNLPLRRASSSIVWLSTYRGSEMRIYIDYKAENWVNCLANWSRAWK